MSIEQMSDALAERRKNPRFECYASRDFQIDFDGNVEAARLSNMSRDGVSFQTNQSLGKDQTYQLHINDLNAEKKIPCEVRVMWVQSQGDQENSSCGARIVRMDPADKMDLLDILYEDWKRKILS